MGTISTSVGLISGLNIEELVSALMQIESAPLTRLQERVATLQSERSAFMELSARLLQLKTAASRLDESDFFHATKAASSNSNVLTASADAGAMPGTYTFQVHSLVTTHQLVSTGYADLDRTPVGRGALTFEIGGGSLAASTRLEMLNGQTGVRTGVVRITDRAGHSADVDLTTALTVDDVLEAINSQTSIGVAAAVEGDHFTLTDTSEGEGNLTVQDLYGSHAAADLGIADSVAASALTGRDVYYLDDGTLLSALNDGNGVWRDGTLDDFRITLRDGSTIDVSLSDYLRHDTRLDALNDGAGVRLGTVRLTDRTGASAEVNLEGLQTIGEVLDAINGAGLGVSASLVGSHLYISDSTGGEAGNLKIEDVTGYAARDLGIAADVDETSVTGSNVYRVSTIGDVVRAINYDNENGGLAVAAIADDGNSLVLTDLSSGSGPTTVEALNGSRAADDLGILGQASNGVLAGRAVLAGLNTVLIGSLNGGSGASLGVVRITDRNGVSDEIDLSSVQTLAEVLDAINASVAEVSARVNEAGTGIVIEDHTDGAGPLVIEDVSGTGAADLGIAVHDNVATVAGGNLQLQWLSESTRLADLNAGRGVAAGRFAVTDSLGVTATINVTSADMTLGDLIRLINQSSVGVEASLNANGDGLLLTDTAGGSGQLRVDDQGGRTASDLRIAGEAAEGTNTIDGSFELRVEIDGDDTLQDLTEKINEAAGDLVQASVINDGSTARPYRLTLQSAVSGLLGRIVYDVEQSVLTLNTLVEPQDAVVFLGQAGGENPVVISSSSNTLTGVIPNVTLDLVGTSSESVSVTVAEDVDTIVEDLSTFVDAFNEVINRIDDLTSFNAETLERGLLLGDATVGRVRTQLYNMVSSTVDGTSGSLTRLNQVGIRVGGGATLQFDEEKFRDAYGNDRDAVEELFTLAEEGLGAQFESILNRLTDSYEGVLARKDDSLGAQEDLLNKRIADLQILLDSREQRLYAQFQAMETALAQLQSQQTALSQIQFIGSGSLQNSGA